MEEKKLTVFERAMLFLGKETFARSGASAVLRVVDIGPDTDQPKEKKETA